MSAVDLREARARAQQAIAAGRAPEAVAVLAEPLRQTYALEEEYSPAVSVLMQALELARQPRGALSCAWYLGDAQAVGRLAPQVAPQDRARSYVAVAMKLKAGEPRSVDLYSRAAAEYEAAGMMAHAAAHREKAGQYEEALPLWSRLSQAIGSVKEGDLYAAALARFNVARTARLTGRAAAAHDSMVAAVHLLEEAADRYEAIGQRERAFDCYQVLTAIGRDSGTVEHALEGYVNVARILREDQLRSYALKEYAEAIRFLKDKDEVAAAATVAREMAAYARAQGLGAVANHALLTQAEMWRELARATVARGAPPEIAENALLASVMSYAELGQFRRAGEVYVELAHLPIEPARRAHYSRAAGRYTDARDEVLDAAPLAEPGRAEGFPEVWIADMIEWEQRGSAAEVCADIIIDTVAWSEVVRRRALLARLEALPIEMSDRPVAPGALRSLVESLAPTELYVVLSALEKLFDRPEAEVRGAVAGALGRFLYKRSFITLRRAVHDPDPTVRAQACKAVEQLHFPHAFDPLARIYREVNDNAARMAALRALGLVDSDEAAETVLGIVLNAGPSDQAQVIAALSAGCGNRFLQAASQALSQSTGASALGLRQVLQAHGMRA